MHVILICEQRGDSKPTVAVPQHPMPQPRHAGRRRPNVDSTANSCGPLLKLLDVGILI